MTNNIDPITLPADADARALMIDLISTATAYIATALPRLSDRYDFISDDDDYIPAAARLIAATTDRFLAHEDPTPRDTLLALITDADFITDLETADFDCDLHTILNLF